MNKHLLSLTLSICCVFAAWSGIGETRYTPLSERIRGATKVQSPVQKVPEDGREYAVVLEEDFSKFTAGSWDNPDKNFIDVNEQIPSEYTQTPGWMGRSVMQAGGAVALGMYTDPFTKVQMTGQIQTPVLDLHRDNGKCYVSFKARSLQDVDMLYVRWVDDESDILPITGDEVTFYVTGGMWNTIEAELTDCTENCAIQVYSEYAEIVIDDFKVEQYSPVIDAPKALKWTNFTGDSFTCNWTEVEGADHYILNVFYIRRQGSEDQLPNYKYIVKDKVVNGTSYDCTGLDPEKTYYYYVRAVNADGVISAESACVEVMDLTVPKDVQITDVTKNGFRASWSPVLNAEGYGFQAIIDHTAPADEAYAILDEKFDGMNFGGEIGDPMANAIGYYDMDSFGMTRANWVMYEGGVINGGICLHNYVSQYGEQYYGELVSPIMTIGQSTGDVTIEADYATLDKGVHPYIQIAVPGVVDGTTQWVLGAGGDINETVNSTWTHISKTYKVKPGLVRFSIGASDGGWLYIDNLKITVNLPEGAKQRLPYHYNEIQEDLDAPSYYCPTPDRTKNDEMSFAVMAARQKPGTSWFPIYITSEWTDIMTVPSDDIDWSENGADAAIVSSFTASGSTGSIVIGNPDGEQIVVMDLAGRTVARTAATSASVPAAQGIYIVSEIGGKAVKVIVK